MALTDEGLIGHEEPLLEGGEGEVAGRVEGLRVGGWVAQANNQEAWVEHLSEGWLPGGSERIEPGCRLKDGIKREKMKKKGKFLFPS